VELLTLPCSIISSAIMGLQQWQILKVKSLLCKYKLAQVKALSETLQE
jgi:hypothetical protein